MEIKIKLYGNLRKFGNEFRLVDVSNTHEAMNALYCQIKGFRQAIQKGLFKVRIGRKYFSMETLKDDVLQPLFDGAIVHITPVLQGSGGVFQAIVGAVFIVVGTFVPGAQALIYVGVALIASGVATMLTKTPEMSNNVDEKEKKQSTAFSNMSNLVAQGRPVPLAYGRIMVGSLVISKGAETHIVNLIEEEKPRQGIFGLRRR